MPRQTSNQRAVRLRPRGSEMKFHIVVPIAAGVLGIWGASQEPGICQRAAYDQGIALPTCPAGKVRQTGELEASGLRRGGEGEVTLHVLAHYTIRASDEVEVRTLP